MTQIIRVKCGGCAVKIKAPLNYQGRQIECPQCGHSMKIPRLKSAAASKAASSSTTPPGKSGKRAEPAAMAPIIVEDEAPLELGADAIIEEPPKTKNRSQEDVFDLDEFEDYGDAEDYEDYGAAPQPRPRRRSGSAGGRPRKKKRKKKSRESSSGDGGGIEPSIIGGLAMMIGAVVWFVFALQKGWIFYYPPIMFVSGLIAFIKGLMD